jgi:hypothetical protein
MRLLRLGHKRQKTLVLRMKWQKTIELRKKAQYNPPLTPCHYVPGRSLNFSNSIGKSKSFNYLGDFVCSVDVSLLSPFPSFLPIFRAKFEPNDGLKLSLEQSAHEAIKTKAARTVRSWVLLQRKSYCSC